MECWRVAETINQVRKVTSLSRWGLQRTREEVWSRQQPQPVQRPWGRTIPGVLREQQGACVSGAE